jgi:hypothetical protein
MGTRNLTKVINSQGEIVVAQYGQWDGYPSGQGLNLLEFISGYRILDQIELSLDKAYWATQDELDKMFLTLGEKDPSVFLPSLTRDTATDIVKVLVYSTANVPLVDDREFENDDLFCEGVYTLDFQQKKFISKFGDVVEFSFDQLPNKEEYLMAFGYKREEVAV